MYPTLYLILAGLAGSAIKAWISMDQATFSKKSIGDVLLGGAVGGLFPLFVDNLPSSIVEMYTKASLLQQALMIGAISYTASDLITGLLARFNIGQVALSPHPISGDEVGAKKGR